jgi:hypothetical protein
MRTRSFGVRIAPSTPDDSGRRDARPRARSTRRRAIRHADGRGEPAATLSRRAPNLGLGKLVFDRRAAPIAALKRRPPRERPWTSCRYFFASCCARQGGHVTLSSTTGLCHEDPVSPQPHSHVAAPSRCPVGPHDHPGSPSSLRLRSASSFPAR